MYQSDIILYQINTFYKRKAWDSNPQHISKCATRFQGVLLILPDTFPISEAEGIEPPRPIYGRLLLSKQTHYHSVIPQITDYSIVNEQSTHAQELHGEIILSVNRLELPTQI